jgi:hypothetical protein
VPRDDLLRWVAAYERAWRTPGTTMLADVFASDATYQTEPFAAAHRGLEAIARLWEAERAGPDEQFALNVDVVAVEGSTGVVRIHVQYGEPLNQEYRDLWIVTLDAAGRCTAFEEWPFWPPGSRGAAAAPAETA